jgi:hypothetical protein
MIVGAEKNCNAINHRVSGVPEAGRVNNDPSPPGFAGSRMLQTPSFQT